VRPGAGVQDAGRAARSVSESFGPRPGSNEKQLARGQETWYFDFDNYIVGR
jgi:hypothetical protein